MAAPATINPNPYNLNDPTSPSVYKRKPPEVTEIPILHSIDPSSCPTNIVPGNISVCGYLKTIDVNTAGKVQRVAEPIEGATVAVYLGVKNAQGLPPKFTKDPNGTGELLGNIEGLYSYDISNVDGKFVVPIPKKGGTNGMAFLAFFCGDYLKDLYMIDTREDIQYMPISLACSPQNSPASYHPNTNGIPAPPSVTYADRIENTSCEMQFNGLGDKGIVAQAPKVANIDLYAAGLDDTRIGAKVNLVVTGTCHITGYDLLTSMPNFEVNDVKPASGAKPKYLPQGRKDVPDFNTVLSRRDLEGYTHSAIGYSFQAISSLNCGIAGCYSTAAPSMTLGGNRYLSKGMVDKCNTAAFPPLNCYGPGLGLAAYGEYNPSYILQRDTEVYPGVTVKDLIKPDYTSIGQLIQDILKPLGIILGPGVDSNDPSAVVAFLQNVLDALIQKNAEFTAVLDHLTAWLGHVDAARADINKAVAEPNFLNIFNAGWSFISNATLALLDGAGAIPDIDKLALYAAFPELREYVDNSKAMAADLEKIVADLVSAPVRCGIDLNCLETYWNSIKISFADLWGKYGDNTNKILNIFKRNILADLLSTIDKYQRAIAAIKQIHLATVSNNYFPYSALLNYNIGKNLLDTFENRPVNDSYVNDNGNNACGSSEIDRQQTSKTPPAEFPFKACYGGTLLGEDTYSTEKALFLTTRNTNLFIKAKLDPPVAKFVGPYEQVGDEINPKVGSVPSNVTSLRKVGKGYWRIGIVNTMCTTGIPDAGKQYPVLPIYGNEGALRAAPK